MNAQKLLYIISQAPYSNASGQEALDAILIGASFEQDISVLFLHDGVFQVKSHQQVGDQYLLKEFTKTYRALQDFGVENIYLSESSLNARGLHQDELIIESDLLDDQMICQLIAEQYRVFTF